MMYGMDGKVCIVTGAAGGGIGQAVAERLCAEGARVVVTDRHPRRNEEVSRALGERYPGQVEGLALDITDLAMIDAVVESVAARLGRVDVLVNNAAVNVRNEISGYSVDEWNQVLQVGLTAAWYLTRRVIPLMADNGGGSIVNITSVAAYLAGRGEGPYAASKAALHSLTRTVAAECGHVGIRCNSVAPGIVETPYVTKNMDRVAAYKDQIPLHRFAASAEIASVVAFLCSGEASYITGETICVSGGFYMRP